MSWVRVIVRTDEMPHAGGVVLTRFRTIDIYAPEVAEALSEGGRSDDGSFYLTQIAGVERLPDPEIPTAAPDYARCPDATNPDHDVLTCAHCMPF